MRVLIAVCLVLFSFPSSADGFHLVCEAKKGVGYRLDTMPDGKTLVDEWSERGHSIQNGISVTQAPVT